MGWTAHEKVAKVELMIHDSQLPKWPLKLIELQPI